MDRITTVADYMPPYARLPANALIAMSLIIDARCFGRKDAARANQVAKEVYEQLVRELRDEPAIDQSPKIPI